MHSFCFCMHFCFLVEKWILSGYKHRNWWSIWVEYDLMRYCIFPTRELKPRKFCYAILLSSRSRFSRARKQSVKYDLGQFPIYEIYKKRLKGFFSILLLRASKFWRENSNLQGVPTSFRKSQIYVKLEFWTVLSKKIVKLKWDLHCLARM